MRVVILEAVHTYTHYVLTNKRIQENSNKKIDINDEKDSDINL